MLLRSAHFKTLSSYREPWVGMSSEEAAQLSDAVEEEDAGKYDRNESFAEEALPKQSLSKDIISECISMPYRLGYGFSHAFVKLDCSDRRLSDVNILREYIHLRFVILSNNFITDISPVCVIGHLIYLKADNNQISGAECLNPLRFLQFLDLSGNKLTTVNNLKFPLLQHLKVNENMIETFEGPWGTGFESQQLPTLHTLEARGNKLTHLKGLGGLSSLKSIYCAENGIRQTDGVSGLTSLVRLHLRDNRICRLTDFTPALSSLEYINLRGNRIKKFTTIKNLTCLPALKVLSLVDNPITNKEDYRLTVIGLLNQLQRLDKDRVTESERSEGISLVSRKDLYDDEATDSEAMEEHHNAEEGNEEMVNEGQKNVDEGEEGEGNEEEEEDEED
ncbi:Leucine-rich repeat-containing protein 23 [Fasciola hepatica]|uniref:Leucine-rich repeat-containing protein 23 n=1 Tax=Fasciola hepatica TaxID=6192 RepID=A0A4E0R1F5_FASHE|nr:Leucine-rich repeat-containing protein 23 [Fasciola hepatica]